MTASDIVKTRSQKSRSLRLHPLDGSKPIVAIITRASIAPVTSGQGDVDHFPSRDEVRLVATSAGCFSQFPEKPPHRRPQHSALMKWINPMAMQFHKEPVGPALHRDSCLLPKPEAPLGRGIRGSERSILDARDVALSSAKINHKRAFQNQRINLRCPAAAQVSSSTMGSPLVKGQRALIKSIDLSTSDRMKCRGRKRQVSIASRLSENLHLVINTTKATLGRIRQGKVAM